MDVMMKVFLAIGVTPILMYVLLIAMFGASLLRSRRWEVAFHHAAIRELGSRGLGSPGWSLNDGAVVASLLGKKPLPDVADVIDADQLDAVNRFLDDRVSKEELIGIRRLLLVRAVRRQLAVAGRVRRLRYLPRVWWIARVVADVEVAALGMAWMGRRHKNRLLSLFTVPITLGTVVGVVLGVALWMWRSANGERAELISTAGALGGAALLAAVCWGSLRQVVGVATAVWGEPRQWGREAITRLVMGGGIILITAVMYATGGITTLVRLANGLGASVTLPEAVSVGGGMVVVMAGLAWVGWRLVQQSRIRYLRLSLRIGSIAAALFVGLVAYSAVRLAISAEPSGGSSVTVTRIWLGLVGCVALAAGVVGAGEWVRRWQRVREAGVVVPLKGFGWRRGLVVAAFNLTGYVLLEVLGGVTFANHTLVVVVAAALFGVMLAGPLLIIAWCVAGWLYVRRVDRCYEDLRAGRLDGRGTQS